MTPNWQKISFEADRPKLLLFGTASPHCNLYLPHSIMSAEEVNPYALLDVNTESTEKEIRTAYRQRSLKVHPDRVCHLPSR